MGAQKKIHLLIPEDQAKVHVASRPSYIIWVQFNQGETADDGHGKGRESGLGPLVRLGLFRYHRDEKASPSSSSLLLFNPKDQMAASMQILGMPALRPI